MILGLLTSILPLIVIASAIAGIVAIARRDEDEADPGIGTVRRLVLYGLAFGAAMVAPTGVGLLLGGLFEALTGDLVIAQSDTELAFGLSFTLVGSAAWGILWRIASATLARHPVEQRSLARHVYFGAVRGVALVAMMVGGASLLRFAFGLDDFSGNAAGFLLSAGGVWLFHQRLQAREVSASAGTRSIGRLYLFGAAFVGLAVLAGGLQSLLAALFDGVYDAATARTLATGGGLLSNAARGALALALVGTVAWVGHWWRGRTDYESTIWRVYTHLGGLLSGITIAIVGASIALHLVLQWFLGVPRSTTAAAHFEALPDAIAGLIVGVLLWGYHRAIVAEHTRAVDAPASETERVYRYLAAAAGLTTMVVGLTRVLATALDLASATEPALAGTPGWWQNQLILGVTLLAVGVPLWLRYWSHVESHTLAGGDAERGAVSRRIFLYAVFGISGLAVLISLSTALFELFQAVLEGSLSGRTLHDARWSLAVVFSVSGVAFYYWQVLRADQRAQPVAAPGARPRNIEVTVVNGADGGALARRLQERLGVRVRAWSRPDIEAYAPDEVALDALARRLEAAPGQRVLLVAGPEGGTVIPYAVG